MFMYTKTIDGARTLLISLKSIAFRFCFYVYIPQFVTFFPNSMGGGKGGPDPEYFL